ncbi:terminase small subunit [Rhodanobacter denitrificans]|uniref:terminase small subunit n=1 Tax=Rhodanobacter denitrificans TaxID=666685 RepID=UPI000260FED7|nr:terminase small subunit [Rhodanobacter denitrificans]EIM04117.1 terminase small subunit [Rhodanobacter denitrificans]UJM88838.1 terminase small subunit [Rhodanobacter denitrificans]
MAARALNLKQRAFIAAFATGMGPKDAAIAAGYSAQSAKHTAHALQQNPLVKAELAKMRADIRETAVYDAGVAMAEARDAMDLAKAANQFNAYVKAMETRMRISGLFVDKLDITVEQKPNVSDALAEARARLLRDPRPPIEGEFCAVTNDAADGAIATQSIPAAYPLHKFRAFG